MVNRYTFQINQSLQNAYNDSNPQLAMRCGLAVQKAKSYGDDEFQIRCRVNRLKWNSKTSVIREIENAEHYAHDKVNQINDYLRHHAYILPNVKLHFYSVLVTCKNAKLAQNGKNWAVQDECGNNPYKLFKNINRVMAKYFRSSDSSLIAQAVETAIFRGLRTGRDDFFNVHEHALLMTTDDFANYGIIGTRNTEYTALEIPLRKRFKEYINVRIKPLVDKCNDNSMVTIDDKATKGDYDTISKFVYYIFKMQKLPIARQWQDVNAFKELPKAKRIAILEAIINSSKGVVLHKTARFAMRKRKINRETMRSIYKDMVRLFGLLKNRLSYKNNLPEIKYQRFKQKYLVLFKISKNKSPPQRLKIFLHVFIKNIQLVHGIQNEIKRKTLETAL